MEEKEWVGDRSVFLYSLWIVMLFQFLRNMQLGTIERGMEKGSKVAPKLEERELYTWCVCAHHF